MASHIGIIACSAEGAALCYRTLCAEAPDVMGTHRHPEITMHTHCLADYMGPIRAGDWEAVAGLMLDSARKVAACGAHFAICPDNTIHQAMDLVEPMSPIPWLHIAHAVADQADRIGARRLALLGTKYLMTGPVYADVFAARQMEAVIPDEGVRERIDAIIFDELVRGVFLPASREYFHNVIADLARSGCEAVVLGCTEIPLLVGDSECPLPPLDSTRLLARAALAKATGAGGV